MILPENSQQATSRSLIVPPAFGAGMTALNDRPRKSRLFGLGRRSAAEELLQLLHLFSKRKPF